MKFVYIALTILIASLPLVFMIFILSSSANSGGWNDLAKEYPPLEDSSGNRKNYPFQTLSFPEGGFYRAAARVTVGDRGLAIRGIWFYRIWNKPMFLPWDNVDEVKYPKWHLAKDYVFSAELKMKNGKQFTIIGFAAREINKREK